jgi:outer membrane immunogenic protein
MLRRTLLASVGAIALTGSAALAAEPAPVPPPVFVPPPPVMTWTGLYLGINAGGTWSDSNSVDVSTVNTFTNGPTVLSVLGMTDGPASALGATDALSVPNSGFIGGGQVGYNFQFANSWLVGIEADIQGIAGASSSASAFNVTPRTGFFPDAVDTTLFVSRSIDYIGTVRGRLGFLVTPTLLAYGTGGLAYGGVKSDTSIFGLENPNTGATPWSGFGSFSDTRVGWTAGGGLEWLFSPNWSAKVEYLYYDLGSETYSNSALTSFLIGTSTVVFSSASQTSTRFNGNIVRAGLNYHFTWPAPVVAKY